MANIEDLRERVREASDIVDVVNSYVRLTKAGRLYKAICPFHQEKTASFIVNPQRLTFKCFGCGEGGDVFTFIQKIERVEFLDALKKLGERAGIDIVFSEGDKKREKLYGALEQACSFFQRQLAKTQLAQEYLQTREINQDSIAQFRLGYAPDSWDSLTNNLRKKFNGNLLKGVGLIRERKSGGYYDYFRNRVIFPIFNSIGRVIGFAGRVLGDEEPKYLNSPETELFSKGKVLYGLNFALKPAYKEGVLVLEEGYTDVILSHQTGIENTAATIGTELTPEHVELLTSRRFSDLELLLCFDGDSAGKTAAFKAAGKTIARKPAKVCLLPEGQDPADLIAKGEDLRAKLQRTTPAFEFIVSYLSEDKDITTLEGRTALLEELKETFLDIPANRRKLCIETLAQKMGVSPATISNFANGEERRKKVKYGDQTVTEDVTTSEVLLIKYLLAKAPKETIAYFAKHVREEDFSLPETRAVFNYITQLQDTEPLFWATTELGEFTNLDDLIKQIVKQAKQKGIHPKNLEFMRELFTRQPSKRYKQTDLERFHLIMQQQRINEIIETAWGEGESHSSLTERLSKVLIMLKDEV